MQTTRDDAGVGSVSDCFYLFFSFFCGRFLFPLAPIHINSSVFMTAAVILFSAICLRSSFGVDLVADRVW